MAGEGDAERLVVLLEARTNDALKAMERAERKFDSNFGGMRRSSKSATRGMEEDMMRSTSRINQAIAATSTKIGGLGKAMVGGFVGGLVAGGVAGIVRQVAQVANSVAQVGDEAKRAGVAVEAFQELKYVAEQNRIGVDSLTDGLKELNLRADEWIYTGGGAAAEAFERLGYKSEELKAKLQDPSALFTEIIGKLGQLDKAAQIRIADEIFGGTGGEKFVQLIEQGEQGIRDTIQEARNLGIVMDQDMIDKAVELDRKFQTITETVGTGLKTAIVEAASALNDFWIAFNEFITAPDRLIAGQGQAFWDQLTPDARNQLRLDVQLAGVRKPADVYSAFDLNPDGTFKVQEPPAITDKKPEKPKTGGRSSAVADAERQEQAVRNLIASLEFEKSLIGLSAVEQAKLNALRQAGAAATDEQKQKISELIEQTHAEQMSLEQLRDTFDLLGQAGQTAVQGIIEALADGKVTAEEFSAILSNVLSMAAQFFLNKAFGGFGSLFGFAEGGYTGAGGKHQPAGIVHKGEVVWSQKDVARAGGVATVEAMRRGLRGYANGGVVSAPSQTSPSAAAPSVIRILLDDGLKAKILNEAAKQSVEITRGMVEPVSKAVDRMANQQRYA